MVWLLIIYIVSVFAVLPFVGWLVERDYSFGFTIFVALCPVLNTAFVICRTIKACRTADWKKFKNLFVD